MSSVDNRVVEMKFDNTQFERGVSETISTLDKLKTSLSFSATKNGLNELQTSVGKFSFGPIATSLQSVNKEFFAMTAIANAAIMNVTNRVINAGAEMLKSLTVDPIKQGFGEYETKLTSIQTILGNVADEGKDIDDVTKALNLLNDYADKTIYNFGEMARNIGTFTAAGVGLDDSVGAIKGLSNVAAITGTNASDASRAMYQLSQAMSSGVVRLQDWMSLEKAGGMGGKLFQDALIQTARVHGVNIDKILKENGRFRNTLQEEWLTSDIMLETLSTFTGELSDAQLKALGYNEKQVKAIQLQAKTAVSAATEVKTFTQLISTLQESSGSVWAQTFEILFGNLIEAKKLWTNVYNVVGKILTASGEARNKMLQEWKDLGGRDKLIKALSRVFRALFDVIRPIQEAFRDIFPPTTAKQLLEATKAFKKFTHGLKVSDETVENLRRTFRGVFAVFDIFWQVIKGVGSVILSVFQQIGSGSGAFLSTTGSIGDFLVALDETIKKGGSIKKFFDGLAKAITVPIAFLQDLISWVMAAFGLFADQAGQVGNAVDGFSERFKMLEALGKKFQEFGQLLGEAFTKWLEVIKPFTDIISEAFGKIFDAIEKALSEGNFDGIIDVLNTGLLYGIFFAIKRFLTRGLGQLGGGFIQNISNSFKALTGSLRALQTNIKAKTILAIAIAVGVMTLSIVALSLIDSKKLSKALGAIFVALTQLLGAMYILDAISSTKGFLKIPFVAASMILLATALLILSAAVYILSRLKFSELLKGLYAVGVLLALVSLASKPLSANSSGMIRAGLGIIAIAIALKIMASAVKDFAEMDWKDLKRGLSAVAIMLGIIAITMRIMPKNTIAIGLGLIAVGVALKIFASALEDLGAIDWQTMGRGMAALAGSLLIIAIAMRLMPKGMVLQGIALMFVATAILGIGKALKSMGGMSWDEIGKGLTVLAASLGILAAALNLMRGTLAGAAALVIATAALAVLTPVLIALGAMSWESIAKGLVSLAGALTIIGIAGLLLTPLLPSLIGLGFAVSLIGAGLLLMGTAALAFATAFTMFAVAGAAGVAVVGALLTTIISAIPQLMAALAEGVISFAEVIMVNGPILTAALATVLVALLDAIIKILPKLEETLNLLIQTMINVLVTNIPKLVRAGLRLLIGIMQGIRDNIHQIVDVAADIIVNFLDGLGDNIGKIVDAGFRLIIKFIDGLTDAINKNSAELGRAGADLAMAMIRGMATGLWAGVQEVVDAALGVAGRAWDAVKDKLGINSPSKEFAKLGAGISEGMALGIDSYSRLVSVSAEEMAGTALDTVKATMSKVGEAIQTNVDSNPVITPVLDLTQLQKESTRINGYLATAPVTASVSYAQAKTISANEQAAQQATSEQVAISQQAPTQEIKFEQNNYSPKALSPIEIYRQTRNQLSLAKEALRT